MNTVYLLTGSNLGNREQHLADARKWIGLDCGRIERQSSLYETAAWGKTDQPAFLNQALCIQTKLDAGDLLQQILLAEQKMGRVRGEKYGSRTIDIDILLFNDDTIWTSSLVVPHPQMQNRRFVLVPLAEIAPLRLHPVLHRTIEELLEDCPDTLDVRKFAAAPGTAGGLPDLSTK